MIARFLTMSLLLFFGMVPVAAQAQVEVQAEVDRTSLNAGEALQLMVTVDGGQAEVDTSAIKDFKVVPQGSSTRMQISGGRTLRQTAYIYTLIPAGSQKKNLVIPELAVTVAGKTYMTRKIVIKVAAGAAQPEAENGAVRDVWVTAQLSSDTPYVGQQIVYTVTLFNSVQVSEAQFQPPEFKGFSAREIENRRLPNTTIDGREAAASFIDYALVPQTAGRYTIGSAEMQVGVVQPGTQRRQTPFDDFFDNPFLERRTITPKAVHTRPLTVKVKPLPHYSGTLPFSGLVGRFEMAARIGSEELTVGDSTRLAIILEGEGNILDVELPPIALPGGLKSYVDTPVEQIGLKAAGYVGRKIFPITLVPQKSGTYKLPEVKLVYFDVERKEYRTLKVALPVLRARPAAADPGKELLVEKGLLRDGEYSARL